jgi:serine/threonine protein kinase
MIEQSNNNQIIPIKRKEGNANSFSQKVSELGYTYVRQIGSGNYANVHLIFSERYNQYFALKQNKEPSNIDLSHELELLKGLFHPNIINIYSRYEINTFDCLVFEYCSRGTLTDLIESNGPIQPPKLYNYCFQILSAVEYLHQNQIAHRDIKPSNILLDSHDRVKLTDFGLSKHIASDNISQFCGSKMFAAPEIHLKIQGFDALLADVYALGATFYTISQGKYPFNAKTNEDLEEKICSGTYQPLKNVDPKFEALILQMMTINPNHRSNISEIMMNPIFYNMRTKQNQSSHSLQSKELSIPTMKLKSIYYDISATKYHPKQILKNY